MSHRLPHVKQPRPARWIGHAHDCQMSMLGAWACLLPSPASALSASDVFWLARVTNGLTCHLYRDKELAKFEAFLNKEECMNISALVRGRSRMAYPIKG